MATVAQVRDLLDGTSLPPPLVRRLLDGASALWLMGEADEQVAADLALCHPPLRSGEVRAIARPLSGDQHKVSVVAPDRHGLLAGTAAALAGQGLSVARASGSAWPELGLAVLRVVVEPAPERPSGLSTTDWDAIGRDLRKRLAGPAPSGEAVAFVPRAPVVVEAEQQGGGRTLVSVQAPDRTGLLWAIASWFEDHGCNIEVARVDGEDGTATDTFVVVGDVDPGALADRLSGRGAPTLPLPVVLSLALAHRAVDTAVALRQRFTRG
jgi:UTP:GlnB (protein PII) uridylyltransferase